ncbi:MAG: hypothetical protein J6P05_07360 [Lachnospiraceae bacterium]|nr:hypothetical protein [Lachnospiraceae bacterium]
MTIRVFFLLCSVLLFLTSKKTGLLLEKLLLEKLIYKRAFNGIASRVDEGDLLDNKLKWRILIIGYIVFILALILETAAIFTLNNKLNTLYDYIQSSVTIHGQKADGE